MRRFALDPRLDRDTLPIMALGLCDLRLMNDSRWPWLILVPKRPGITEMHDLSPLDQAMLTFETALVAGCMKRMPKAEKLNIGMLGNVVPMLHLHIVARAPGDPNWPGPVWGFGTSEPYADGEAARLVDLYRERILAQ